MGWKNPDTKEMDVPGMWKVGFRICPHHHLERPSHVHLRERCAKVCATFGINNDYPDEHCRVRNQSLKPTTNAVTRLISLELPRT